jgi:hypothetical protein
VSISRAPRGSSRRTPTPDADTTARVTDELWGAARFLGSLPGFLRRPVGSAGARATLGRRIESREPDFLALVRRAVYGHAASPYRRLLRAAGCEYPDLERLVAREGVDGALRLLHRQGVYLTVDEFKGRRPAVRGSVVVPVDPRSLRNPASAAHLPVRTGGSRSAGTPFPIDLGFVHDCAVDTRLAFDALGGAGSHKAIWEVPGAGAVFRVLKYAGCGHVPARWFSQVDPADPALHPRYRWSARAMGWGGILAGTRLPRPDHVPADDPLPIARWMVEVLRAGGVPHLRTFPSSAVNVCQAAHRAGLDLSGALLMVAGEPVTAARVRTMRAVGARVWPRFGSMETGPLGFGCLSPSEPDEVHLVDDLHAVVQIEDDPTLWLTSLRPRAPLVLLNASLGDRATPSQRRCGCPLEELGWGTHLHTIRSHEKLTAAGMTFLDTDVLRILEEVLPARFGGAPTEYQLLEEETADGQPRLALLVHPAVGPLDPDTVRVAFLEAIGTGSGAERVMALLWRDTRLLRIERRPPMATASGKILHLHAPGSTEPTPP